MKKPEKCICPGCKHYAHTRGVCQSCYVSAKRLINEKKTTWAELERMKLVRPSHHKSEVNALRTAFVTAKAKAKAKKTSAKPKKLQVYHARQKAV